MRRVEIKYKTEINNSFSVKSNARLEWVKVMLFQWNSSFDKDWVENAERYSPKYNLILKKNVCNVINYAKTSNVNLLVFPELSIPKECIPHIVELTKGNKDLIIVAGSHYYEDSNSILNQSPIIYNGSVIYTHKIHNSDSEYSPYKGKGVYQDDKYIKKVVYFRNTIIGNFIVLICADNLKEVKDICLNKYKNIDFLIVIAFQKESLLHHNAIQLSYLRHSQDFYSLYVNNKCDNYSDGKSAVFGVTTKDNIKHFSKEININTKIKDKLLQISDKCDGLVLKLNLSKKDVSSKRRLLDIPGNISEVEHLTILNPSIIVSDCVERNNLVNKTDESYDIVDNARSKYNRNNINIEYIDDFFCFEIPFKYKADLQQYRFDFHSMSGNIQHERLLSIIENNYSIDIQKLFSKVADKTAEYFVSEAKRGNNRSNRIIYGVDKLVRTSGEDVKLSMRVYKTDNFTFKFMSNLYLELKAIKNIFKVKTIEEINKFVPFLNSIGVGGFIVLNINNNNLFLFTQRSQNVNCSGMWHFSYDKTFMPIDRGEGSLGIFNCLHRGVLKDNGIDLTDTKMLNEFGVCDFGVICDNRLEFEICSYVKIYDRNNDTLSDLQLLYSFAEDGSKYKTIQFLPVNAIEIDHFIANNDLTPEACKLSKRLYNRINLGLL